MDLLSQKTAFDGEVLKMGFVLSQLLKSVVSCLNYVSGSLSYSEQTEISISGQFTSLILEGYFGLSATL